MWSQIRLGLASNPNKVQLDENVKYERVGKMRDLEVGMVVYTVPVGANNTRYVTSILDSIEEGKISKIGRKYFYLDGGSEKFNIDNLRYDSEAHYDLQAYLDKKDIFDEIEAKELQKQIKNKFSTYGKVDLNLEQLKKIVEIIGD